MEGPSIVIATEELAAFKNQVPKKVFAASPELEKKLRQKKFLKAKSWGKHLILYFTGVKLRIHFLMFGSYRIDKPRENRIPKLELQFDNGTMYFYSCAIREITSEDLKAYDWSMDLMSDKWNAKASKKKIESKPNQVVSDLLMDQSIFSGLGNIMKNEILFRLKMHPETRVSDLTKVRISALVKESEAYAWKFYDWKKENILKRNWLIFRKKTCPVCGRKVIKKPTGKGGRISHYCSFCQKKN